jgi:hypothetical protein
MRKIVFLGDSLTADTLEFSWARQLCQELNLGYHNLAVAAGNNRTQVLMLQHYLLSDEYSKDDIFFWEINSVSRYNTVLIPDIQIGPINMIQNLKNKAAIKNNSVNKNYQYQKQLPNIFDLEKLSIMLCHEENTFERKIVDPYNLQSIEEVVLQEVVSHIVMLARVSHNVIYTLGWESAVAEKDKSTLQYLLNNDKVQFIDDSMLDWCVKQNLPLKDDMHPDQILSTLIWARTNLVPRLRNIIEEDT